MNLPWRDGQGKIGMGSRKNEISDSTFKEPHFCKRKKTMDSSSLYTLSRIWKQPECPSTEECTKMRYMNMMKYYSAIKRNEIGSFVDMWMDPEHVTDSEVSQKEKSIIYQCIYKHTSV